MYTEVVGIISFVYILKSQGTAQLKLYMTADSYMYPNGTHTFWLTSPFPIQCTWVLVTDHAYMYIQCRLTLDSLAHSPFPIPHSPYSVHTHTCDRPCLHVHVYTMQVDSRLTSPFPIPHSTFPIQCTHTYLWQTMPTCTCIHNAGWLETH